VIKAETGRGISVYSIYRMETIKYMFRETL